MNLKNQDPEVFYYEELENFKIKNTDKNELDFINQNLEPYEYYVEHNKTEDWLDENYLVKCIKYRNYFRKAKESFLLKNKENIDDEIDLSDTSAVEKIIYLHELGIIDFLRTKTKVGISNGGLATVLSGITGIKSETIKPSLNRLTSNDTDDNRHPYYTKKTVEKIKSILINLGF